MTIYLVTKGEYSDYSVVAAFSTEELAQSFIDRDTGTINYNDIEPLEVDGCANSSMRTVYHVEISPVGDFVSKHEYPQYLPPHVRMIDAWVMLGCGFAAQSTVSFEHALKCAAEKRQEWMREQGLL